MRRGRRPFPLPPSLPWEPPEFPAQPRRPPAPRGRGGAGEARGPTALRERAAPAAPDLPPASPVMARWGAAPAGVAVLCQPRSPPSPRWIGAAGPARRRPRSVSRQRRRGRAGREQVRRGRCRPRRNERAPPRSTARLGGEVPERPAARGDPHGSPASQNTPGRLRTPQTPERRRRGPALPLCQQQRPPGGPVPSLVGPHFGLQPSCSLVGLSLFLFFIMPFKC